jgi:hypothetical protein
VQKFTLACQSSKGALLVSNGFCVFFVAFYGPTIAIPYVLYYPRLAAGGCLGV